MTKTALIVDDSAAARLALERVLGEHELSVDTAASAEDALEYLKEHRPDVIFMDHLMPGMDGFQALEAIKANPATATIPVMMYTSQEGELYVGQARALGAFGVLPKQLKPLEVAGVLGALRLIPGPADPRKAGAASPQAGLDPGDSARVKELLEELFYQQRSVLREEIRHGYERLLGGELKSAAPTPQPLAAQAPPEQGAERYRLVLSYVAGGLLLLVTVMFGYLYFETSLLLQQANDRIALLISGTAQQSMGLRAAMQSPAASPAIDRQDLLSALEWGVNQGGNYAFEEIALDATRAQQVSVLFDHLRRAGFSGTVAIDAHVGRYCMNLGPDGELRPAPPEQPAAECDQLGWLGLEAQAMGERQTLAFANTAAAATRDDRIRLETLSFGATQPAVEYPLLTDQVTAGEWNRIAARNQRIEFRLLPRGDGGG